MGYYKILVVDDEETVAEYCSAALREAGYDVVTAHSGEEAIERASAERFSVLLTDIKMDGMDGMATFRTIKELDSDIAGIVMTGYGSMENAMQALQLGFTWFLAKPFTIDELTSAVERTLENVRLARENVRLKALVNLHELAQTSGQHGNLDALLTTTLHVVLRETGADAASVELSEETPGAPLRRLCVPADASNSGPIADAERFMSRCISQMGCGRTFLNDDADQPVIQGQMQAAGLAGSVCLPLMSAGDVIGTLTMHRYQRRGASPFTESDLQAATVIGTHAAIVISHLRLRQSLKQAAGSMSQLHSSSWQ
jgi:CheY-like chemotaxis protein